MKEQLTYIMAHDSQDGITFLNFYALSHFCGSDDEAVAELRKQVKEWGKTDVGAEAREDACGSFNWGDLSNYIDDGDFGVKSPLISIRTEFMGSCVGVEHDELLLED